ncbi:MAG: hypothetical protein IRY91_15410, partial [Gemmatimonadaceae bacterium]|nr:hypothetical protein [Gemmatimonadaceae bacterium]
MPLDLSIPAQLSAALAPDLLLMGGAMVLLLVAVWGRGGDSEARSRLVGRLAIALCVLTGGGIVWMVARHAGAAAPGVIAVDNFRWAT